MSTCINSVDDMEPLPSPSLSTIINRASKTSRDCGLSLHIHSSVPSRTASPAVACAVASEMSPSPDMNSDSTVPLSILRPVTAASAFRSSVDVLLLRPFS